MTALRSGLDHRVELLRVCALSLLLGSIRGFGDCVTEARKRALDQLITGMVEQALGTRRGRIAYGLPCGGGKTQAVVALIVAPHMLDHGLTFAVCANTIKALCLIKRDLTRAGVPGELIGLRHNKSSVELAAELDGEDIPDGATRDTGDDDRPIMLVSHNRIKGSGGEAFARYKDEPRSLVVWDETLFASESGFVLLRSAMAARDHLEAYGNLAELPVLHSFMANAIRVAAEERGAPARGEPARVIDLAAGADAEQAKREWKRLRRDDKLTTAAAEVALSLLRVAERAVAVAAVEGQAGNAIIHHAIVVGPEFDNIAVLDASFSVRLLAQAGGVEDGTTPEMRNCRTYENVTVRQVKVAASKSAQIADDIGKAAVAAKHAAQIIANDVPPDECVLIFAFKDTLERVKRTLRTEGVDLDGEVVVDRTLVRRVRFATWGQETSTNVYADCKHVILAGVLRRNRADVVSILAGEAADLLHRRRGEEVAKVMRSEMAHSVLQAMHRGNCRRTDGCGRALEMTLYIIDREPGLDELLREGLPGVNWPAEERPASELPGRARTVADALRAHLDGLSQGIPSVKSATVKAAVESKIGGVGKDAWRAAVNAVTVGSKFAAFAKAGEWLRIGHSLVRAA